MNSVSREYIDDLSGLYNRRYLNRMAVECIREAGLNKTILSLVIIDLDHFKNVNDTYGHSRGDSVLMEFAVFLGDLLRKDDTVFRYGGDEFICILPHTEYEHASKISHRFIEQCRSREFAGIRLTMSIGIASFPFDGQDFLSIFNTADHRLYSAKRHGRDRIGIPDKSERALIIPTDEIIGRDSELSRIRRYVDPVSDGSGGAVSISGEIGVGKTRLVREILNSERYRSFQFLSSNLSATTQSIPYYPFREILRSLTSGQDPEQILQIPEVYRMELAKIVPELSDGTQGEDRPDFMIDKFRLFEAVRKFLELQLGEDPLFICIDNIHWVDKGSHELLYYLLKTQREIPVFYFLIYRVEEVQNSLFQDSLNSMTREDLHRIIALELLESQNVTLMISSIINGSPPPELSEYIYSRTGGNPYFIEELLKSLKEDDALIWNGSKWLFDEKKSVAIPYSIESVVDQKLHLLSEKARKLFEYASVIGRDFDFGLLKNITGMNEGHLFDLLDEMLETRLLTETGREHYRFPEDIIRESVYTKIGRARLGSYHRTVAEKLLELHSKSPESVVEELCHHFYRSGDREKAAEYGLIAAGRAKDAYANEDAIRFYDIVIECLPETGIEEKDSRMIECLRDRAEIYSLTGKNEKATEDLECALSVSVNSGNRKMEAECLLGLNSILLYTGQYGKARKYIENASEIFSELNDREGETKCLQYIGNICWYTGEHTEALEHYHQAYEFMVENGNREETAKSLSNIGIIHLALGDYQAALGFSLDALRMDMEIGNRKNEAGSLNNIGAIYMKMGDYSRALEYYKKSLFVYEETGNLIGAAKSYNNTGIIYITIDKWREALDLFRKSLRIKRDTGDQKGIIGCQNNIGTVYNLIGKYTKALECFNSALSRAVEIGDQMDKGTCFYNIADVHYMKGEYSLALKLLRDSLQIKKNTGDRSGEILSLVRISNVFIKTDDISSAEKYNREAYQLAENTGSEAFQAIVLINSTELNLEKNTLEGMDKDIELIISLSEKLGSSSIRAEAMSLLGRYFTQKKNWKKAESRFHESIRIYKELEYKFNIAEVSFYYSIMLETSGDTAGAEKQFDKAGKTFKELGTQGWLKKINARKNH